MDPLIVERFGRFVLGEDGWRAEWVVIKEVLVQSKEIGDRLRAFYPDLVIHVEEPEEINNGYRKGSRDRSTGVTTVHAGANNGAGTISVSQAISFATFNPGNYATIISAPTRDRPSWWMRHREEVAESAVALARGR